jgi:ribosomal protein S18 acetylase RimI-like enzyme
VDLDLIEKRLGPGDDKFDWRPFEQDGRFNDRWWNDPLMVDDDTIYVQVRLDGIEVARVDLDDLVDISHFTTAPQFDGALEIEFIEVASTHRRRGIGRAVVDGLVARYPDRRFVAFRRGCRSVLGVARLGSVRAPRAPRLLAPALHAAGLGLH